MDEVIYAAGMFVILHDYCDGGGPVGLLEVLRDLTADEIAAIPFEDWSEHYPLKRPNLNLYPIRDEVIRRGWCREVDAVVNSVLLCGRVVQLPGVG